jgi:hypothetical protein
MRSRIEDKINIHYSKILQFKKWILDNNGKKIYPNRKINSIYFDTNNFQMFKDSEEGCSPRLKLRIRFYNDNEFYLEKKESNINNRSKDIKRISIYEKNLFLTKGIFNRRYGVCKPKLIVSYHREYFSINSARITIDYNIKYQRFDNNKNISEKDVIAEIKSKNLHEKDQLSHFFYFPRIRFSKYCRGISSLFF